MTGWAFRGLWFGNGKEIVMRVHIGIVTAGVVLWLAGNLPATIIEHETIFDKQDKGCFAVGVSADVRILALLDWDINEDTVINSGTYNLVRVDFNNPDGNTTVSIYGGSISVMHTYYSSTVHYLGGTIYGIDTLGTSRLFYSGGTISSIRTHGDSAVTISGANFSNQYLA